MGIVIKCTEEKSYAYLTIMHLLYTIMCMHR